MSDRKLIKNVYFVKQKEAIKITNIATQFFSKPSIPQINHQISSFKIKILIDLSKME